LGIAIGLPDPLIIHKIANHRPNIKGKFNSKTTWSCFALSIFPYNPLYPIITFHDAEFLSVNSPSLPIRCKSGVYLSPQFRPKAGTVFGFRCAWRCAMKKLFVIPILCIVFFSLQCFKSPTEPDLEDISKDIPWEKITGKIAFTRRGKDYYNYLYILNGKTKSVDLVTKSRDLSFKELAFKFDGSVIAFAHIDFNFETVNSWKIFTIKPDGTNLKTVYPSDSHCHSPAWSRDGRLAYWGFPYEFRVDGRMIYSSIFCISTHPAWSPDCQYLVISAKNPSSHGSLYRISLSNLSASPELIATGGQNNDISYNPIYSFDGSKIAFDKNTSDKDSRGIWMMDADGSNMEQLTTMGFYPAWSPDGHSIAFCEFDQNTTSIIYIVNIRNRSITKITEGEYPVWIP
jgi:hypothetical protein